MGSVIIPLERDDFFFPSNKIRFDGEWFEPKDELHITVIGKQHGKALIDRIAQSADIEAVIGRAFEAIDWQFNTTGPVHVLSRLKEETGSEEAGTVLEKTIIIRLDMPGMAFFYDGLKDQGLIPNDLPTPPPHVTLYSRNCPGGIGLPDDSVLNELSCETLSVMEFRAVCYGENT